MSSAIRRAAIAAWLATLALAAPARAQDAVAETPAWSVGASGTLYLLPDDEPDHFQPTVRADRGRLHLESRYGYEDLESVSLFAGMNFEWGEEVVFALTPMLGGVVGRTDGIIPGFEADLTFGKFEAYGEAEHVFALGDDAEDYFYLWSELSVWPTENLRAGLVAQRTRVHGSERELERGLLVGAALRRLDATAYFFNPWSDDAYAAVAVGVRF